MISDAADRESLKNACVNHVEPFILRGASKFLDISCHTFTVFETI